MYQAGVEWILGFRLRGTTLLLDPCIPRAWPRYEIDFRYHSATYEIVVENPQGVSRGVASSELDGQALTGGGAAIPLADDGATHQVRVAWGSETQIRSRGESVVLVDQAAKQVPSAHVWSAHRWRDPIFGHGCRKAESPGAVPRLGRGAVLAGARRTGGLPGRRVALLIESIGGGWGRPLVGRVTVRERDALEGLVAGASTGRTQREPGRD